LDDRELWWMAYLRGLDGHLTNISVTPHRQPGPFRKAADYRKPLLSAEHRAKISEALRGKPKSAATRAKMRAASVGRPSPNRGKSLSAEHRAKISEARRKGAR